MAILIKKHMHVMVQGIGGREGSRAAREMRDYGTNVVAGVSPNDGDTFLDNIPVYRTVREALTVHPKIAVSLISVPAAAVLSAGLEAIEAGIPIINILTEHVTVRHCAILYAAAKRRGVRIVGPSSVGIISPGEGKIGSIGSGGADQIFTPGPVGVISKSGGMTAEIGVVLSRAHIGQSTVVGIGGDQVIGSDFADLLALFKRDASTRAVVLFGEIGGTYEERAAAYIRQEKFAKPVVAIVAGKFTSLLPQGTALGHAGAIVSRGRGSYDSKIKALRGAGVMITQTLEEIPQLLKKALRGKIQL